VAGLKLLMLNYEFPPIGGGAGNAHLNLLRQYSGSTELVVDVLTSAPTPGAVVEQFADNIRIYKVGIHKKDLHFWRRTEVLEWLLKARRRYRQLITANRYDLVHSFFGFPTGLLPWRTAGRLPYIVSLRGSDVPGEHARLKFEYKILGPVLFKPIWENASALVACSEGLRKRALKFLPTVQIEVIPNGVDLTRFVPSQQRPPLETLKLLTVGRLSVTKRFEVLIGAVELLHRAGRNVQLRIVGGGQLQQPLRQLIRRKALQQVVELTGRVEPEAMPELYRSHHIFVSATMQEGMSNAMLEAMASGLPIITTRCEGTDELIQGNGLVLDKAQPQTFAEAIQAVADDEKAYNQMSLLGRKRAELFDWNHIARRYIDCYQRILSAKRAGR